MVLGKATSLTIKEFLAIYRPTRYSKLWSFKGRDSKFLSINRRWEAQFFFVSGEGWEFHPSDIGTPLEKKKVPCQWGVPDNAHESSTFFLVRLFSFHSVTFILVSRIEQERVKNGYGVSYY